MPIACLALLLPPRLLPFLTPSHPSLLSAHSLLIRSSQLTPSPRPPFRPIFILAQLTAATLVTFTWRILAASHRSQ